jgi:hypothetical protein
LFKKAQAEGLVLEGEERMQIDVDDIAVKENGIGGSINTF